MTQYIFEDSWTTAGACYFKALQDGLVRAVVPIDKLSILMTVLFAHLAFHERLSRTAALGLALFVAGTLLML